MTRILVIDDNARIRKVMELTLSDAGYLVASAADGRTGLRIYREFRPDIVITDIIMPEREGIETIRDLRALSAAVPIIAVSGGGQIGSLDVLSLAEKLGASRVLAKPFSGNALLNEVRKALEPHRPGLTASGIKAPQPAIESTESHAVDPDSSIERSCSA